MTLAGAALPDPPELPPGARAPWPVWTAFAAMGAGTAAVGVVGFALLPVALVSTIDGAVGALALLALILVQDVFYLGAAVLFVRRTTRPRPWQFGLRPARALRTIAVALAATLAVLGFEVGFLELVGAGDAPEQLAFEQGFVAALAISLATIVVAPVAEELFFRAFVYRVLRNRMAIWLACLVDGAIFSLIHVQYLGTPELFVVIAVFAIGACLAYELTGSIFAPIAMHAAFNTLALLGTDAGVAVPLAVGAAVLAGCAVVPSRMAAVPSPFPPPARA